MNGGRTGQGHTSARNRPGDVRCFVVVCALAFCSGGCASYSFPVTGIPVYRVPPELLAVAKDDTRTIDLALLGQPPVKDYRLAAGDVVGVWIGGITGGEEETPPVRFTADVESDLGPAVGLPLPVQGDGTVDLPLVGPVSVSGMTLAEAKEAIRRVYVEQTRLLQPGFERIIVTLAQPRMVHVLVFRQESGGPTGAAIGRARIQRTLEEEVQRFKQGTGYRVSLPANMNDVIHALAETGGLPGIDAVNEIIIQRASFTTPEGQEAVLRALQAGTSPERVSVRRTRIPLRTVPGAPLPFRREDVVLQTGDVVFIEARESDVFYTGGLLPPGEFRLPRDHDLDVVEAITLARGPFLSGGLAPGNFQFNSQLLTGEIGGPSPSLAIVLRKTRSGAQVPIRVDLNRAMRDPSERIIIQPNDVIVLQQTPDEALARYLSGAFRFDILWRVWDRGDAAGMATLAVP